MSMLFQQQTFEVVPHQGVDWRHWRNEDPLEPGTLELQSFHQGLRSEGEGDGGEVVKSVVDSLDRGIGLDDFQEHQTGIVSNAAQMAEELGSGFQTVWMENSLSSVPVHNRNHCWDIQARMDEVEKVQVEVQHRV